MEEIWGKRKNKSPWYKLLLLHWYLFVGWLNTGEHPVFKSLSIYAAIQPGTITSLTMTTTWYLERQWHYCWLHCCWIFKFNHSFCFLMHRISGNEGAEGILRSLHCHQKVPGLYYGTADLIHMYQVSTVRLPMVPPLLSPAYSDTSSHCLCWAVMHGDKGFPSLRQTVSCTRSSALS